jgi:murein DD-endopeptidase MepM/ murein hydrolase activator NlpD
MDLIVISSERTKTWRLSASVLWLSGMAMACLLLTVGFGLGQLVAAPVASTGLPSSLTQDFKKEVSAQRAALAAARLEAEAQTRATAQRMAQLHAQLLRLDAAGERMITLANLDPKEFSFGEAVAVGGPEADAVAEALPADPLLAQILAFENQLSDRERQLRVLEDLLLASKLQQDVSPSGWPVIGGYISSIFGYRSDPFTGRSTLHQGIDFAGPYGSPVYSVASGVVQFSGEQSGYGKLVEINHGNGYVTRYGHSSALLVNEGDAVRKNQVIAKLGSSGRSTGPHVHFEVLVNGRAVDPAQFVHAAQ